MMTAKRKKYLPIVTLLVLGLTLILSACDGGTVAGPDAVQADSWRVAYDASQSDLQLWVKVVHGEDGVGAASSAVIGAAGGAMKVANHRLHVPADALAEEAIFTMALEDPSAIQVDLTASSSLDVSQINDIGAAGFDKPLKLVLSYSAARNVDDPSKLAIAGINPDGSLELISTTIDEGARTLTAYITHFSGYIVVTL